MAWLFLLIAGLCEPAWAIGLKYTEGFSRLLPTIGTVAAMVASNMDLAEGQCLKNSSPTCRVVGRRGWRSGRHRQMRRSARTRMELARIPISPSHALFPYDADRR